MNKRFLLAWLIVFILWMAGSFLVHGVLLGADYAAVQNLFRTPAEAQHYFPLMILAHVIMSGALVWIYSRRGAKILGPARAAFPRRHRAAHGGALVHDLLCGSAHARRHRPQTDRVR